MKLLQKSFKNTSIVLILLMLLFTAGQAFADKAKDVILVLDTSLSMVGYGGKNILDSVKTSINNYVDKLEDGDRVTFMTFDTKVRVYPSVIVDDDNDRDILKKYISMTEATGAWTHTFMMINSVFGEAQKLAEEDDDRQVVIVVMTDGLDDPPPGSRRQRFDIGSISNKYHDKDWWIYLVNFNDLAQNEKVQKARDRLKKQLERVSGKTTVIDASKDPGKGIEQDLPRDIEKREAESRFPWVIMLLIVLAAIAVAVIYYIKQQAALKISGKLHYWNNDILNPDLMTVDLGRYNARILSVGRGFKCDVNLREFEVSHPYILEAVKANGKISVSIHPGEGNKIEFKNRDEGSYLEDGDIFVVANHTFKYTVS